MDPGIVYLVGAGPGHPQLFTIRGRNVLARADVVVYDRLIPERLLQYAPSDADLIYAGKRPGNHRMTQEQINQTLVERAAGGATVVRLKGGDPFVFGRGGEEALALAEAGIQFEIVPGITAGLAAPAWAGIPVTHRNIASSAGLITGHHAADTEDSPLDWEALARWEGTLSFYMGVGKKADIARRLIENGKDPETPAALVRWGTTPGQRTVQAQLRNIAEKAEEAGLEPPALLVIGEVVALREKLNWYERRPLFDRRIVITRPRPQAEEMAARVEEMGGEPVLMPTIKVGPPADPGPLRRAMERLDARDWIIFTSANGVDYFFHYLDDAGLDARALAGNRICAIGTTTAGRLEEYTIHADLVPDEFTTAGIVEEFASMGGTADLRVLCPRSDIAPPDLVRGLAELGAEVEEVDAYSVVPEDSGAPKVLDWLERDELNWLTFTSTSTVDNLFARIDAQKVRNTSVKIASIGPSTSEAIRSHDLQPSAEATPHTVEALLTAIVEAETN